jgi:EAL domain-containing protein (putative c-di-GMP-specific phosphodiesterase class I)
MFDANRAMENFTCLRSMGLQTSIDDFGTGYSSLAYLKRLPVNQLKIDKSFVLHMATDPSDLAIVRTIVDLGHNLGLSVVAEGVEDQASMDLLAAIGCDLVQGYFLSRPQPAAELLERLNASPWRLRRLTESAALGLEASPSLGHQKPTAA